MESIKTAFVVVLLLAVLFSVYTVLNKPDGVPPKEVAWMEKSGPDALKLDIGAGTDTKPSPTMDMGSPVGMPSNNVDVSATSGDKLSTKPWSSSPGSVPSLSDATPTPSLNDPPRGSSSPPLAVPELTPHTAANTGGPNPIVREWHAPDDLRNRSPQDTAGGGYNAERGAPSPDPNSSTPPTGTNTNNGPQVPSSNGEQRSPGDAAVAPPNGGSRYAKTSSFELTLQNAQQQINNKQYRDALLLLSRTYGEPNLTTAERNKLLDWLDPLAGKVIYSTEHLVEPSYRVQRGDTLFTIATQYAVPFQLLQNINGVRNPEVLIPDTQLKVMRGPFRAEVDLTVKEVTLFVQQMYAGRFPISVGEEPIPKPGEYEVRNKELGHAYFGGGQNLPAEDPRNPYGRCWIDLGKEVCIHGSSAVDTGAGSPGCIGLSPQDANDIFGILSQGSQVLIRR